MKNFVQRGDVITYKNAGAAIKSGDVVPLAAGVGVAAVDIAATTGSGSVVMEGVFKLAKEAPLVIAQGDKLYWDNTAKVFTKTAMGNTIAGFAHEAALSADTTVLVNLEYMSA